MSDRDVDDEHSRLHNLEEVSDPATTMRMGALGIAPGWHCLEVGAGGGSIARWMAGHVGPTGRVVATDLDPVFVEELPRDNLVALRHDIATEDLPGESFDLVHCRDVLMHVSNARAALNRMVGAPRPGGFSGPPRPGGFSPGGASLTCADGLRDVFCLLHTVRWLR